MKWSLIILTTAALFASCGSSSQTAAPTSVSPVATHKLSADATESHSDFVNFTPTPAFSELTAIASQLTSITLNNVVWSIEQPEGVQPLVAAGDEGVLWVRFPQMLTNEALETYDMPPIPTGDYALMYTLWRPGGGRLEDQAEKIATFPSDVGGKELFITGIASIEGNHFLVYAYNLSRNAVNGGPTRVWWIEPSTNTVRELLSAPQGGGRFLTLVQNQRWLFWQRFESGAAAVSDSKQTALVDLRTGTSRKIDLPDNKVVPISDRRWDQDGTLRFRFGQETQEYTLDPETGIVARDER